MPRITSQQLAFAHSGIDRVVKMYRQNRKKYYPLMTKEITNKEAYYNIQTVSSLPPAAPTNEATGVNYADIRTPFNLTLVPTKQSMGFSCSYEVIERDLYGILKQRGKWLADSVEKAMDLDVAGFLINATNGSIVTPDRVALASTAHLFQGGFYSNILSNNSPLSAASLEQAMNEMEAQPDDTGDPMGFTGPYDLWVSNAQMGLANRLAGTTPNGRLPQTNNNDDDWAGGQIRKVIVNPYWNSTPNAWMLVSQSMDEENYPFLLIQNSELRMPVPQYDMDKDVVKGTALSIWVKGVQDPRGFIYSAGG